MTIGRETLLFFDAVCLIAASGSPSGGSSFLLLVCARGYLSGAASQPVLLEAERNIRDKLGAAALARFHRILQETPLQVVPVPGEGGRRYLQGLINEKDDHVVAAAVEAGAPYLLTLERTLAAEVNRAGLSLRALTPGEFITPLLPTHSDYPSVRG